MTKKIMLVVFIIISLLGMGYSQEAAKEEIKLDAGSCIMKCKNLVKAGKVDEAIRFGEKAVELEGSNSDYHFQLGLAYSAKINHKDTGMMEKMGIATKMLNAWKKSVELDGKNLQARQGLLGFYLNAPPIAGGSVEKAEEQAKEIVKLDELVGSMAYAGIYIKQKEFVKGIDFAVKAYKLHMSIKKDSEKKSSFNTNFLNDLGYGLVNSGKTREAIEIFEMNVKAYPGYWNAYDSLAETCMNSGQVKPAIKYYEKALALNPNKTEFEKRAFLNQKEYLKKLKSEKK